MPLEPFASSEPLTFGIELELQLVSLSDFDLTPASPDLMHLLKRKPFPGNVTPEITESMVEINSSVHTRYRALLAQLLEIRDVLVAASDADIERVAGRGQDVADLPQLGQQRQVMGLHARVNLDHALRDFGHDVAGEGPAAQ